MMVRRYVVREMPEAIVLIRKELGKDAVILSTKRVSVRKWMGLWRQHKIEVVAAIGDDVPLSASSSGSTRAQVKAKELQPTQNPHIVQKTNTGDVPTFEAWVDGTIRDTTPGQALQPAASYEVAATQTSQTPATMAEDDFSTLRRELQEVRQLIENTVTPGSAMRQPLGGSIQDSTLVDELIDKGFSTAIAKRLVEDALREHMSAAGDAVVQEPPSLATAVVSTIYNRLESVMTAAPFSTQSKMVALVGATGVGKTTTVAKLAALNVLAGRRVGLITLDTFRIAAIEQLRTYANILNVPLEVVYQEEEIQGAVDRLAGCDIIFVDTAGRNYRSNESVAQVKRFLDALSVDEVIMVMSVTSKIEDMHRLAKQFHQLPIAKFLFTKLDETDLHGSIIEMMLTYQKPLCFVTNGQNVPDDIEVASVETLVHGVLGGAV